MNTSNPYAPPRAAVQDVADPNAPSEPAGRLIRLGGALLDGLLLVVIAYLPLMPGAFGRSGITLPIVGLVGLVVVIGLNILFVSRNGQSIGKKLLGIKVVRTDGTKASLGRIFWLRNVVNGICNIVPLWWVIDSLVIFGERRQCLHDKIADTVVIKA